MNVVFVPKVTERAIKVMGEVKPFTVFRDYVFTVVIEPACGDELRLLEYGHAGG